MFGYITPDKPEMKIKEFELFRGYYCGVCKAMGRSSGIFARFALNYDSVFLGLFLSSLHEEKLNMKKEICFANPLHKKLVIRNSRSIQYAADINVMLMYHKLIDNWMDEKNIASAGASIAFKKSYIDASRRNKKADHIIKTSLTELHKLEEEKCQSFDQAAEPFSQMMKKLLSIGYYHDDDATRRVLEWLGYNIGKWVYIIDAFDDLEKDVKNGCYNPLLSQFGYKDNNIEDFKDSIREEIKESLTHTLWQASNAMELLKLKNKSIVDNILYEGMYKKLGSILDKRSCNYNEQSK